MNVSPILEIQEKVPVSAPLALASCGIPDSGFPDSSKPLHQVTTLGILLKVGLDPAEHIHRRLPGQMVQLRGEYSGFDVYHKVAYTTLWYISIANEILRSWRIWLFRSRRSRCDHARSRRFLNPAAADHQVVLVEHDGLSRSDGALRLVKGDQGLAVGQRLDGCRRGLMAMPNLGPHT